MDIDFSIGNERESLGPLHHHDDGVESIMASYATSPPTLPTVNTPYTASPEPGYLRHLIDQMQVNNQAHVNNQLNWVMQRLHFQELKQSSTPISHNSSGFGGLNVSISKEALRWILLLLFIIALIVILLQVRKHNKILKRLARRNPIKYFPKRKKKQVFEDIENIEDIEEDFENDTNFEEEIEDGR